MSTHADDLLSLYALAGRAFAAAPHRPAASGAVAAKIFDALATVSKTCAPEPALPLPVCRHLDTALELAGTVSAVSALAHAFRAVTPSLSWYRRPGSEVVPGGFHDAHANAIIAGPRGLDVRHDVLVGASLMAPQLRYPDHHHPPEELYVVLSPGEWWQTGGEWHEPGPGGVVHNPPGITHAMRSGDSPLLALWFLDVKGSSLDS